MAEKSDLYREHATLESAFSRMDADATITAANKAAIRAFTEDARVNGKSTKRQLKLLYSSCTLARLLGKDFTTATKEDVRAMLLQIEDAKKDDGTPKFKLETRRSFKVILKMLFRHALGAPEGTTPAVVAWVKPGTLQRPMRNRAAVLEPQDIDRLTEVAKDLDDRLFIRMLFYTAGRIGEVTSLRLGDCRLEAGRLDVTLHGFKTGGDPRTIPVIDPKTLALFEQYIQGHPQREDLDARLWPELVSYNAIKHRFLRYQKKAGLAKPIRFHWFRHSRATLWQESGFGLDELKYLLGDKNDESVRQYTETTPQVLAMEKFRQVYGDTAQAAEEAEIEKETTNMVAKAMLNPKARTKISEAIIEALGLPAVLSVVKRRQKLRQASKSPSNFAVFSQAPGGNGNKLQKRKGAIPKEAKIRVIARP